MPFQNDAWVWLLDGWSEQNKDFPANGIAGLAAQASPSKLISWFLRVLNSPEHPELSITVVSLF